MRQYSRENPALYRRSSVLVCPACNMPSFAPSLHEEADTRIFACAMEAAKNKWLRCWYWCSSSVHTCGATVVSGWTEGLAKIAGYRWCEIKLFCFIYLLTGCNKTSLLLGREKRCVSFPAVTWYFVKMNSPWKATYRLPLCHWTIHHSTVWYNKQAPTRT